MTTTDLTTRTNRSEPLDVQRLSQIPAAQQPNWPNPDELTTALESLPKHDLVDESSTLDLARELRTLDDDEATVLQLGDCVEDIDDDVYTETLRKLEFIDQTAAQLAAGKSRILRVGRLAGQHAKPRSNDMEHVNGHELPSFRGPAVNGTSGTEAARRPTPSRLIRSWEASHMALQALADYHESTPRTEGIWTSHEMLLIDYELHHIRDSKAGPILSTTHWPWIGARTNQHDGAHVAVAAALTNPISVKIGPGSTPANVAALARILNPEDEPGKLTFIVRMGRDKIEHLPDIVHTVQRHGRTAHWMSDPMHGNTVTTQHGCKTRHVEDIIDELTRFQQILLDMRLRPAGLHLEATPDDVHECTSAGVEPTDSSLYRSLLDPRLNPEQTSHVLNHWFV